MVKVPKAAEQYRRKNYKIVLEINKGDKLSDLIKKMTEVQQRYPDQDLVVRFDEHSLYGGVDVYVEAEELSSDEEVMKIYNKIRAKDKKQKLEKEEKEREEYERLKKKFEQTSK